MNEQEKICACPEWWIFNNLWFSVILCTIFSKSNGPGGSDGLFCSNFAGSS